MDGLLAGMKNPRGPYNEEPAGVVIDLPGMKGRKREEKEEAEPEKDDLCWYGVDEVDAVQPWLVKDMLPEVGVVLLSARRKMGKTGAALDLVGSVITTLPFAGHEMARRGGALYIAVEGVRSLPMRLRALVEGKLKGDAASLLPLLPEGYLDKPPIAWLRQGRNSLNLQDRASLARLAGNVGGAMDQMQTQYGLPLAIIVIDTMNRAAKFKDGNDAAEAQKVMDVLTDISEQTKALIVVLDHYGKDEDRGTKGSSNKEDSADVVLVLQGNAKTGRRSMKVALSRVGEEGTTISYKIKKYVSEKYQDKSFFLEWGDRREADSDDGDEDDGIISEFVAAGRARQWGSGEAQRELKRALDETLETHGQIRRPFGVEGKEQKVVEMAVVRAEFGKGFVSSSEKKTNNAFDQAVARAKKEGHRGKWEMVGIKYLWLELQL
jgi:hypothetical protein